MTKEVQHELGLTEEIHIVLAEAALTPSSEIGTCVTCWYGVGLETKVRVIVEPLVAIGQFAKLVRTSSRLPLLLFPRRNSK